MQITITNRARVSILVGLMAIIALAIVGASPDLARAQPPPRRSTSPWNMSPVPITIHKAGISRS